MMRNHAMVADLSKRQLPYSAYELPPGTTASYHPSRHPKDVEPQQQRLPGYAMLPDPSKLAALRVAGAHGKRPLEVDSLQAADAMLKRMRADVIPIRGNIDPTKLHQQQLRPDWRDEVGEAIEEPVMMVHGEGSGSDCDAVNPIVGEAIEEPVMFFFGQGSGAECETGNPTDETSSDNKEEQTADKEVLEAGEACSSDLKSPNKPKYKLGVQVFAPTSASPSPAKRLSRWDVGAPDEKSDISSQKHQENDETTTTSPPKFFFGPNCVSYGATKAKEASAALQHELDSNKMNEEDNNRLTAKEVEDNAENTTDEICEKMVPMHVEEKEEKEEKEHVTESKKKDSETKEEKDKEVKSVENCTVETDVQNDICDTSDDKIDKQIKMDIGENSMVTSTTLLEATAETETSKETEPKMDVETIQPIKDIVGEEINELNTKRSATNEFQDEALLDIRNSDESREKESSSNVEQPSSNIVETTSDVEKSSLKIEESSSNAEEPSSNTEEFSSNVMESSSNVEESSTNVKESSSNIERPSSNVEKTSLNVEELPSNIEETSVNVEELPSNIEETSVNVEEPSSNVADSLLNVEESSENVEEHSSNVPDSLSSVEKISKNVEEPLSNVADSLSNVEISENVEEPSSNVADSLSNVDETSENVADSLSNVEETSENVADSLSNVEETAENVVDSLSNVEETSENVEEPSYVKEFSSNIEEPSSNVEEPLLNLGEPSTEAEKEVEDSKYESGEEKIFEAQDDFEEDKDEETVDKLLDDLEAETADIDVPIRKSETSKEKVSESILKMDEETGEFEDDLLEEPRELTVPVNVPEEMEADVPGNSLVDKAKSSQLNENQFELTKNPVLAATKFTDDIDSLEAELLGESSKEPIRNLDEICDEPVGDLEDELGKTLAAIEGGEQLDEPEVGKSIEKPQEEFKDDLEAELAKIEDSGENSPGNVEAALSNLTGGADKPLEKLANELGDNLVPAVSCISSKPQVDDNDSSNMFDDDLINTKEQTESITNLLSTLEDDEDDDEEQKMEESFNASKTNLLSSFGKDKSTAMEQQNASVSSSINKHEVIELKGKTENRLSMEASFLEESNILNTTEKSFYSELEATVKMDETFLSENISKVEDSIRLSVSPKPEDEKIDESLSSQDMSENVPPETQRITILDDKSNDKEIVDAKLPESDDIEQVPEAKNEISDLTEENVALQNAEIQLSDIIAEGVGSKKSEEDASSLTVECASSIREDEESLLTDVNDPMITDDKSSICDSTKDDEFEAPLDILMDEKTFSDDGKIQDLSGGLSREEANELRSKSTDLLIPEELTSKSSEIVVADESSLEEGEVIGSKLGSKSTDLLIPEELISKSSEIAAADESSLEEGEIIDS